MTNAAAAFAIAWLVTGGLAFWNAGLEGVVSYLAISAAAAALIAGIIFLLTS